MESRSPAPSSTITFQRYRGAIFDFEGTLVDFQWRLARAENELRRALARLGFEGEPFTSGNYATLWNAAAAQAGSAKRVASLRRALYPIYDRWDADALSRWSLRAGAVQLLGRLAAAGVRAGMVSNIGRRALGEALERFDLARRLSPVVSRDDVGRMKPDVEGIRRVLEAWQAPADTVLFVGDSRADLLAARAAGLSVAIIRGGEFTRADLAQAPPDHLIDGLEELRALLAAR